MADLSCLKHGDIHPELTRYRRGMDFSVSSTKSQGGWNRRQEPFDLNVSVEFCVGSSLPFHIEAWWNSYELFATRQRSNRGHAIPSYPLANLL
jgi:hypothetical protein